LAKTAYSLQFLRPAKILEWKILQSPLLSENRMEPSRSRGRKAEPMRKANILPNRRWRLGYAMPPDRRIFFRILNAYPVNMFILDKPNFEIAGNGGMFFSFGGGQNIRNQVGQVTLPNEFIGDTVFYVIENPNPMPVDVAWEAGMVASSSQMPSISGGPW